METKSVPAARRFTAARRATYLKELARTGNKRAAAEAIGMDRKSIEWRRQRDPALDRECEAALAASAERLTGAKTPFDGIEDEEFEIIRRGKDGRPQIAARQPNGWSRKSENLFFAVLSETGNIGIAARAAGFNPDAARARRRQWPAVAARWEEALEDAALALEFQLATMGTNLLRTPGADGEAAGEAAAAAARVPFNPAYALQYLKWREEKRAGRGARGRPSMRRPDVDRTISNVVRKVEAMRRHRAKKGGGGGGAASG